MKSTLPVEKTTHNNPDSYQESKRKQPLNGEQPQKENQNKHYPHKDKNHFFKINDQHRLEKLRETIQSAPDGKPIRLYIKNIPSFANEFDFEDKCQGLLNVVWNQNLHNCCFILLEDKKFALDVLNLESSLPKYCKEGHIFVNRAEQNPAKQGKRGTPSRFENNHEMSNNCGFFIVENDIMKYFWYDQAGGFYDENGIYYNRSGKPQIPPYVLRTKQNNHQNTSHTNVDKEKTSNNQNINENLGFNENNNFKNQPKNEKNNNKNVSDSGNNKDSFVEKNDNNSVDSNNAHNNTKQPKKKHPKEKKNSDSNKELSVIEKDSQIAQDNSSSPVIAYLKKDKEIEANNNNNGNNEKRNKQKARKNEKSNDSNSSIINNQNGADQCSTNQVIQEKEIPLSKCETDLNVSVKSESDGKTNKQQKEGRIQGGLLLKQIGLIRQQQEHCRPQKLQGKENDLLENA